MRLLRRVLVWFGGRVIRWASLFRDRAHAFGWGLVIRNGTPHDILAQFNETLKPLGVTLSETVLEPEAVEQKFAVSGITPTLPS